MTQQGECHRSKHAMRVPQEAWSLAVGDPLARRPESTRPWLGTSADSSASVASDLISGNGDREPRTPVAHEGAQELAEDDGGGRDEGSARCRTVGALTAGMASPCTCPGMARWLRGRTLKPRRLTMQLFEAAPTGGSQVSLSMHDATARRVEAKPLQPAPCIRPSLVSDRAPRCRSATPLRTMPRDSGVGAVVLLVATLGLAAFLFASLHHAVLAPWWGALPMATPPW